MTKAESKSGTQELTVQEAARWLGVSAQSGYVNRLIREKVLPASRHGAKSYRINLTDLERLKANANHDSSSDSFTSTGGEKADKLSSKRITEKTKMLTVAETARKLRVTTERVYQLLATPLDDGGLPGAWRGGAWEIAPVALNEYKQRRRRAGRPATEEGEWVSQSIAAEIYGNLRGRKVSRQAIHDLICKGRLVAREMDGVRLVLRRDVIELARRG